MYTALVLILFSMVSGSCIGTDNIPLSYISGAIITFHYP
jgi:hypothetical protein